MSIQHKNFKLKDLKYKIDQGINQQILSLVEKFDKKFIPENRVKLAFSQKVDFIYNTTAMEGNTFTYVETETLLSGVTIGGHSIKEENEIINQQKAWKFTLDSAFTQPKIKITESLIKDVHWRVGKDTVVSPGQYRDGRVKIGGSEYVPPKTKQEIEEVVKSFVVDFNSKDLKENIFIKAVIIHFVTALIQPFFDGNKRTARLLMDFVLLQNNYPLLSIPVKIRKQYMDAMIVGYESLNIDPLIKLLSDLMLNKLKEYNL